MLANTARLLSIALEVWQSGRPQGQIPKIPGACADCAARTPSLAAGCLAERRRRVSHAGDSARVESWVCARGLSLHAVSVRSTAPEASGLVAIARTARAAGGETQAKKPPSSRERRVRRFLRDLAQLLSDQSSLLDEHRNLEDELAHRYDELQMLHTLSTRLAGHADLMRGLSSLAERARDAVGADQAVLLSRERHLLDAVAHAECAAALEMPARRWGRLLGSLDAWVSEGPRGPLLLPLDQLSDGEPVPTGTLAAARLCLEGRPVGLVAFVKFGREASFRLSDSRLLQTVAQQISLGLSNGELYENLQAFLMATVKTLVHAIEAKDSYTSGHSERVHVVSLLLGRTMELAADEMETLRWASILHDVGKIGMPECILRKPSPLDAEEIAIVRQHPDRGYQVLAPIAQLAPAAIGLRSHHERFDGKGYPAGMSGREIPLVARIITVADAYDAITTDRPYRRASPPEFARSEILRGRGTQFDPEIVDAFVQLFPFLRDNQPMIHAALGSDLTDRAA